MLFPTTLVGSYPQPEWLIDRISIETAQSGLDCSVLAALPGKQILLGVLDLSTPEVETPDVVAERIRKALAFVAPDRIVVAPDCGMKYLPRSAADGKMRAMVAGAALVRQELSAASPGAVASRA